MFNTIGRASFVFVKQGGTGFHVENTVSPAGLVSFELLTIFLKKFGIVTMQRNDGVNIARPERSIPILRG